MQFIDLKRQFEHLRPAIEDRINGVLEHGRFILGPEVQELEQALASYCGVRHAIGVANGTDALHLALMAADIGPGDAVFAAAFTQLHERFAAAAPSLRTPDVVWRLAEREPTRIFVAEHFACLIGKATGKPPR